MLLPLLPFPFLLQAEEYRPLLTTLFSRYVDACLEHCRRNFKTVVPLPAVNQVRHFARLFPAVFAGCSCRTAALRASEQTYGALSLTHSPCHSRIGTTFCCPPPTCACVQVMTICKILEGILPKEKSTAKNAPAPDKKLLEYHFVFACVWAFGGCMMVDKVGSQEATHCGAVVKLWCLFQVNAD